MSDTMMAEIKSLGTNLSKIGEAMTQKLDPLPGELKSMKDAIAEMQGDDGGQESANHRQY